MMSILKSLNSAILLVLILMLPACGEDWALKEETFAIAEENDGWVPVALDESTFIMIDNSGISQSYDIQDEEYYLDKSWGGYFGITTHMTFTEYRFRSYSATYEFDYSTSIRASTWEPYGDVLWVKLYNTGFRYDLSLNIVSCIELNSSSDCYTQTSEGYRKETEILSVCEYLDSVSFNNKTYYNILHFELLDDQERWGNYTVTQIYIAKKTGLIHYELNNGIIYDLK